MIDHGTADFLEKIIVAVTSTTVDGLKDNGTIVSRQTWAQVLIAVAIRYGCVTALEQRIRQHYADDNA